MIKLVYKSLKIDKTPSPFFAFDDDILNLIKEEFIKTGKIIDITSSISDDRAILNEIYIFDTEQSIEDFIKNEVIAYALHVRLLYNIHHRIDFSTTKEVL